MPSIFKRKANQKYNNKAELHLSKSSGMIKYRSRQENNSKTHDTLESQHSTTHTSQTIEKALTELKTEAIVHKSSAS